MDLVALYNLANSCTSFDEFKSEIDKEIHGLPMTATNDKEYTLVDSELNRLKAKSDYKTKQLSMDFASLKFWTPELIEWIGKTIDPVKLSVAGCLVNSGKWPQWLPGKPQIYSKWPKGVELHFRCEVYKILKEKSELISPKLYMYIWLTEYYNSYVC